MAFEEEERGEGSLRQRYMRESDRDGRGSEHDGVRGRGRGSRGRGRGKGKRGENQERNESEGGQSVPDTPLQSSFREYSKQYDQVNECRDRYVYALVRLFPSSLPLQM